MPANQFIQLQFRVGSLAVGQDMLHVLSTEKGSIQPQQGKSGSTKKRHALNTTVKMHISILQPFCSNHQTDVVSNQQKNI